MKKLHHSLYSLKSSYKGMIRLSVCVSVLQANTLLTFFSESHNCLDMSPASSVMLLLGNCLVCLLRRKTLNHKNSYFGLCYFTKCILSNMYSIPTAGETVHNTLIIQITKSFVEKTIYILLRKQSPCISKCGHAQTWFGIMINWHDFLLE